MGSWLILELFTTEIYHLSYNNICKQLFNYTEVLLSWPEYIHNQNIFSM